MSARLSDSDAAEIESQVHRQLAEARVLKVKLRAERKSSADGYPRQSMSEGGGRSSEHDDDGTPLPARPADPTGQAVIARSEGRSGQVGQAERQLDQAFVSVRQVLESAIGRAVNVLEPPKEDPVALQDGILGCSHHATVERPDADGVLRPVFEPTYEKAPMSGLCRWCWDHLRADGQRPPREALQIHVDKGAHEAGLWFARQEQKRAS